MLETHKYYFLEDKNYREWLQEFNLCSPERLRAVINRLGSLSSTPKIGVVGLKNKTSQDGEIEEIKKSLNSQIYPNWEVYSAEDRAAAIKIALESDVEFILPLPVTARLHDLALAYFVLSMEEYPRADIFYADEDFIEKGEAKNPQFKSEWDWYFNLGRDAVGLPVIYRSSLLRQAGIPNLISAETDNYLHALLLRASDATTKEKICHLPYILCHRTAPSDWNQSQAAEIVMEHLNLKGVTSAEVRPAPLFPQYNKIYFPLPSPAPLVSIIIPTKDRPDLIGQCIDSILQTTDYSAYELIIVDNNTTSEEALAILKRVQRLPNVRVIKDDRPFNYSQLNNCAAKVAQGDILLLLNNDTKVNCPDWLKQIVSLVVRPDVGVVGARLLYPDFRVQHSGICCGADGSLYHEFRFAGPEDPGPRGELALIRNVWAVTGACLAIRKSLFLEVGGLDEESLRIAYSDVDLCRKVASAGFLIICTPFVELLHYESVSRGKTVRPRAAEHQNIEFINFWSKNKNIYGKDIDFDNVQLEKGNGYVDLARPPRKTRLLRAIEKE